MLFLKTFALIAINRNRDALSQLVKIDHEQNEMADPWET
jgi:hypothetical protein